MVAALAAAKRTAFLNMDWVQQRSEPYRMLFPLGSLLAAAGMGVWIPYAIWPAAFGYPGQGHAVVQIQGFLSAFIFGFLATMVPKTLGLRPAGPMTYAVYPLALCGGAAAALLGAPAWAQAFHLLMVTNFLVFIAMRYPGRRSQPPPAFLFLAAALLVDLAGTAMRLGADLGLFASPAARAAATLQYQAFPLLLILGVGGFLLPRLFAQSAPAPSRELKAANPVPMRSSGWGAHAALCCVLLASYGIEIGGLYSDWGYSGLRAAYALRTAAWAWFLWKEIALQKTPGKLPPYLRAARISLWVIGAGLLMPVFRPQYMLAWEHVIFLSGFMRLTLSIAARVLAAHAGRLEVLGLHARQVRVYGMLIVFAMMTRIATEIWPGGRALHLAVAALLGLAALRMWARLFLPLARVAPGR